MRTITTMLCMLFFASCNQQHETKARIIERKQMDSGRLMIKYTFSADRKPYTDSVVIDNTVINEDSVGIEYDQKNPLENQLIIDK